MQCCQQCGAKSWAPLTSDVLPREVSFTDANNVLICDGCGQWGLKSVIESNPQPIEFPPAQLPFLSGASLIQDMFKSAMPPPETRLERLVKVIMRAVPCVGASGHESGEAYAAWAVAISRAIEKEMDREELLSKTPPSQEPDADFHRFADGPSDDIGTHR